MALRIGGIPVLLSPSEVAAGARSVLGWTDATIELVAALPERLDGLLTQLELLTAQANQLAARIDTVAVSAELVTGTAEKIVTQAAVVTEAAQEVVVRATVVTDRADGAIADAAVTLGEASGLLEVYRPIADRALPLARRFVEEFSEEELQAAIRLVDTLPKLTEHVESDVLPILATLDHVGPDMQELLAVVKDVRAVVSSLPGMRLLRRRNEADTP